MPGVSHSRALVCLHGSRDGVGLPKGDEARTGAKRRGILPIWRISADSMEPAVPLSLPLSLPLLLISSARLVFLSYAPLYASRSLCFRLSFHCVPPINPNGECQYPGWCVTTTTPLRLAALRLFDPVGTSVFRPRLPDFQSYFVVCFSARITRFLLGSSVYPRREDF